MLNAQAVKKFNKWVRDINTGLYRPYLTVRSVNKFGRRHWLWCDKQQREVHLLSDGERRAYEMMIAHPGTVSVLEQYALDIDETITIAAELGYVHPRNHQTNQLTVMTTDFLLRSCNVVDGVNSINTVAYTYKYSSEIYSDTKCSEYLPSATRTIQKLKIEQEFWRRRGIDYRIITELHATKERVWNLQFCRSKLKDSVDRELAVGFSDTLFRTWCADRYAQLSELLRQSALQMGITIDDAEQAFYFCVLNNIVRLKNSHCIQTFRPIELE